MSSPAPLSAPVHRSSSDNPWPFSLLSAAHNEGRHFAMRMPRLQNQYVTIHRLRLRAKGGKSPARSVLGAHCVTDQGLSERPGGARHAVAGGDHRVERVDDPLAIGLRERQRRQQLDGMAAVTGDLGENLVVLEQRNGNKLAEQALAGGLDKMPRRLEFE